MASDECSNVPTDNCCQQEQQHSRNETAKQLFIHIWNTQVSQTFNSNNDDITP